LEIQERITFILQDNYIIQFRPQKRQIKSQQLNQTLMRQNLDQVVAKNTMFFPILNTSLAEKGKGQNPNQLLLRDRKNLSL
jgi:hypothetical protein